MTKKLYNQENTYESSRRFTDANDLWTRFTELREKVNEGKRNREFLMQSYQRKPWRTKDGNLEPNWGQFQFKIDEKVRMLAGVSLERRTWCRIETHYSDRKDENDEYSDLITEAFHKYCLNPWSEKDELTFKTTFDAVMFSKGVLQWQTPLGCYPCTVNIEDVYPDTNASICPKTWDYVFIRKRYSLVELYQKIEDKDILKIEGWNKEAVLTLIGKCAEEFKNASPDTVMERLRRGEVQQLTQDQQISLLFCYVKEYKKNEDNNQISLYVIPEEDQYYKMSERSDGKVRKTDFIRFSPHAYKCFSNIVATRSSQLTDGYYSAPSFAEEIFLVCKEYDRITNRSIAAIGINTSVFLKVNNQQTKEKLQKLREGLVHILGDGDDVTTLKVPIDPRLMTETMRGLMQDSEKYNTATFQGSEGRRYPLTAREVGVQQQYFDSTQSTETKIWVSRDRDMLDEIFCRFTDEDAMQEGWPGYEGFKQFKKFLKQNGVPPQAWKKENIVLYSRYNQFAGNASSRYQTAQALVQATQLKPASPAEYRAKIELIASIVGEANLSDYMDQNFQFDDEIVLVGQENQDLDDPGLNPANVPVLPNQNHVFHVEHHLEDYTQKLKVGNQMIQLIVQTPQSPRKSILLYGSIQIVNSQDFKAAHIVAHLQQLQSDHGKQDDIKRFQEVLSQLQSEHDSLKKKLQQLDQEEQQQYQQQAGDPLNDLEYQHKMKMYQLDEMHQETINNLGLQKAIQQTESRQQNSIRNQEIKEDAKLKDIELKQQDKAMEIAAKQEKARLDLQKESLSQQRKQHNDI